MKKLYGFLILILCLPACTGGVPAELTEAERAEIQASVEKQLQVILKAETTMDANAFASIMALDGEMINTGNRYVGIDAVREHVANAVYERYQSWEETWAPVEVNVLNHEWASFIIQATVHRQRLDGQRYETNPYLYFSGLFRETNGEWKLAFIHASASSRLVKEIAQ